jgi:hypothetical protein
MRQRSLSLLRMQISAAYYLMSIRPSIHPIDARACVRQAGLLIEFLLIPVGIVSIQDLKFKLPLSYYITYLSFMNTVV